MPVSWVKIGERSYLPLSFSLNGSQNSKRYLRRYGDFNNQDKALLYQNRFYWPKGEVEYIARFQIEWYGKQGPRYLWRMAQACETQGKNFEKNIRKLISKRIDGRKELSMNLGAIFDEYRRFVVFMTLPWVLDAWFGDQLHQIITRRNPVGRVEIEKKLNQPLRLNEGEREQISLLSIASKMKRKDDISAPIRKSIKLHIKKYGWLPMRWLIGSPLTQQDVLNRLADIYGKDCLNQIHHLKNQQKQVRTEFVDIAKRLTLTRSEKELVLLLKEYVFIRTYRSDLINKMFLAIIPRLEQAADALGVSYEDVLYLSYEEIITALDGGENNASDIPSRKKSWLLYRNAEKITILSGEEAEQFAQKQGIVQEDHASEDEIQGRIGYSGKIAGTVAIVGNPNDLSKVKKGDILVTVMTFPSYIAAMERAAAFVTDEGGVLCHAAIIAREMKKPCVIGTQKATKVFRDGDTIEVDANQGVVRIVKRGSRWP